MAQMRQDVVVGYHLDEVVLTPFVVCPGFLGGVHVVAVVDVVGVVVFVDVVH